MMSKCNLICNGWAVIWEHRGTASPETRKEIIVHMFTKPGKKQPDIRDYRPGLHGRKTKKELSP